MNRAATERVAMEGVATESGTPGAMNRAATEGVATERVATERDESRGHGAR